MNLPIRCLLQNVCGFLKKMLCSACGYCHHVAVHAIVQKHRVLLLLPTVAVFSFSFSPFGSGCQRSGSGGGGGGSFFLPPEPLPQSALPLAVAAFWRFSELKERKWERETSVQLRFDGKGKKRLSSTHTFDTLSDLLTLSDKTVWFQWH